MFAVNLKVLPSTVVTDVLFNAREVACLTTRTVQVSFSPLPSWAVAVIVTVPIALPVILPLASTEAILVLLEVHLMLGSVAALVLTVAFRA